MGLVVTMCFGFDRERRKVQRKRLLMNAVISPDFSDAKSTNRAFSARCERKRQERERVFFLSPEISGRRLRSFVFVDEREENEERKNR